MLKNSLLPRRIYKLRLTLFALVTLALLALIFTSASAVYFFNKQYSLSNQYFSLKVLSQDIARYDEILTMSALVAAHDQNAKWRARYDHYELALSRALQEAADLDPLISAYIKETSDANEQLMMFEQQAFNFVSTGQHEQAVAILSSEDYQQYKAEFSLGLEQALQQVLRQTRSALDEGEKQRGRYLIMLMSATFLVVSFLWFYLIRYVRLSDKTIESVAKTDVLSGLKNRREFNQTFPNELNRAKRDNKRLMLAIVDIDNFKKYNDRYGHPKGDDVIQAIGTLLLKSTRRANESAFRLGGEEFAILKTCDDIQEGKRFVSSVCREVVALDIVHDVNPPLKLITVSCGVAFSDNEMKLLAEQLYEHGDQALYEAKRAGKNQYSVFQSELATDKS